MRHINVVKSSYVLHHPACSVALDMACCVALSRILCVISQADNAKLGRVRQGQLVNPSFVPAILASHTSQGGSYLHIADWPRRFAL